jgi:hypothetical protein
MEIAPCLPYHAQCVGFKLLKLSDGKSAFKIYYLSMLGRENRARYEWNHSPLQSAEFEQVFKMGGHEGIGFVTAFPHVAKIFRFSPYMETILDVREFSTAGMGVRDSTRADGSREFACLAEAVIAGEEYTAWAAAPDVETYLAFRCEKSDFPVSDPRKMARYWE